MQFNDCLHDRGVARVLKLLNSLIRRVYHIGIRSCIAIKRRRL